jgi:hypothetical protein
MIRRIYFCLIFLFFLVGCREKILDKDIFTGTIQTFNDIEKVEYLSATEETVLDGPFYGIPAVYDSLMIFYNSKLPGYLCHIFNLKNGKELGSFCAKGQGPEEAIAFSPKNHLFIENNELKTWIHAPIEEKIFKWNISESIKQGKTIYDTIVPFLWREENNNVHYLYVFRLDGDTIMASLQTECLTFDCDDVSVPSYQKRVLPSNQKIRDIKIYERTINNTKASIVPVSFFCTVDCIKPDGTKIVECMYNLCQINIIDTETGIVTGYRMDKTPDYSLFATKMRGSQTYYINVQADDNFIYAVYSGERRPFKADGTEKPYIPSLIHVFDWNGILVKKIQLDHPIYELALDPVNQLLYVWNMDDEKVYKYDLSIAKQQS